MKLFTLLNKLDFREVRRFQHFVNDPLFNQRADVQSLIKIWINERGRKFPPEVYWKKIIPTEPYTSKKWNLLKSRLFKLLEEFLSVQEFRKNEAQKKFYLAKSYRKIQQDKLFSQAIREAGKALKKNNIRDTVFLQSLHDLSFENYDYIISLNRKAKTNLQEVSDHLDAYILAAKLRQACYAESRKTINQEECKVGFLEEVLLFIEKHPSYLELPAIAIYYYCYQAISSLNNESYFRKLRVAIDQHQAIFPPSEMRDIYTLTINFAIRQLNTGSPIFVQEALELYQLSLKQGYLLEDGIMLESTYSNIVILAAKLGQYKWATKFINDYKGALKTEFRAPLYLFSLAKLLYEQGQLTDSLQQLAQVDTKASFLLLGARILQLKIYYELEEWDVLEHLIESLRVYLHRSKDLGYRKANYINILHFTRQLLLLPVMSKSEKAQLRTEMLNTKVFTEKEWFLKQIDSN